MPYRFEEACIFVSIIFLLAFWKIGEILWWIISHVRISIV